MVPKEVYETFSADEQKLWHSHDYEVKSGMLAMPKPDGYSDEDWEAAELEAMKEVVNLYGKTWHTWQVDAGHQYPLGLAALMGSATSEDQVNLDKALANRDKQFGIDYRKKSEARKDIQAPNIHPSAFFCYP